MRRSNGLIVGVCIVTALMSQPRLQVEGRLNWNSWIRQAHRWVTYSPLLPLALLLFSGLYLFMLPYAAKWRTGRRT